MTEENLASGAPRSAIARLMESLQEMRQASDLIDESYGGSDYNARLIALALIAREFLRRDPDAALRAGAEALAPSTRQCPATTPGSQIHDPARCALPVGHVGDHRVAGPAPAWLSVRIIAKQIRQAARLGTLDAGVAAEWADALEAEVLRAEALAPSIDVQDAAPRMDYAELVALREENRRLRACAFTEQELRLLIEACSLHREKFTNGYAMTLLQDKLSALRAGAEALAPRQDTRVDLQ